jgi:alkylation response protein AidB-like acyl-CoA dehydrogenase
MENGKPRLSPDGEVEMVMALATADQAQFLDNWHVLGMRGTDSCDVILRDAFVPKAMTFNLHDMHCVYDMPAAKLPLRVVLSFPHCSVATGLAEGAIDDLLELAITKRASMNPNMLLGEDAVFRDNLGRAVVRLEGAKAMTRKIAADCWQAGVDGRELTAREVLSARLLANFVTSECTAIVDWAYTVVGSSSVHDGSTLQRRLRDIHVATQHASCHTDPYRNLGAVMMGVELSPRELF